MSLTPDMDENKSGGWGSNAVSNTLESLFPCTHRWRA